MVQLNDGPATPGPGDRMEQAIHDRLLPGEGEFALSDFLAAVDRSDTPAPVSIEVFSDPLFRLPSASAAQLAADSTREVLSQAFLDRPAPAM
jgi:sugar phosphate isomerase/epimerase